MNQTPTHFTIEKKTFPSEPPRNWGNDNLSNFINYELINVFASFERKNMRYSLLSEINELFIAGIESASNSKDYVPAWFFLQAHSSLMCSAFLSLSAQAAEAYRVMRGCLENALYGLHVHRNPDAAKIWADWREEDEESKVKVRKEFSYRKKILPTLNDCDIKLAEIANNLYERTIAYGAHPNQLAFFSNAQMNDENDQLKFTLKYANGGSDSHVVCIKSCSEIGATSLLIFKIIWPERFKILGISEKLRGVLTKIQQWAEANAKNEKLLQTAH